MDFIFGFCGAIIAMALAVGVFYLGWKSHAKFVASRRPDPVQGPDAEEKQRLIEEQEAYDRVQNYNINDAYGLNSTTGGGAA